MSHENEANAPWYKQRWLWFILSPLIAVFIYGTFFLYLSIITADGVVKDDYYKVARGIEQDSSKAENAAKANLKADLTLDNLTGDIVVKMSGNVDEWPKQLALELIHPTHKKYDVTLVLKAIEGHPVFRGNLPSPIKGKRYLTIEDSTANWRLRTEINGPYEPGKFLIDANGQ